MKSTITLNNITVIIQIESGWDDINHSWDSKIDFAIKSAWKDFTPEADT